MVATLTVTAAVVAVLHTVIAMLMQPQLSKNRDSRNRDSRHIQEQQSRQEELIRLLLTTAKRSGHTAIS